MTTARRPYGKPLRVLMVSDFPYQGVVVGGVQAAVQILAEALAKLPEIEKVVLVNLRPTSNDDLVEHRSDKLIVHHIAGQRRLALPTNSFLDFRKTKRIASAFRPDVVHGQGTSEQGDIAVRLGYPSVVTIHGVGSFEAEMRERDKKIIGPLRVWLIKRMVSRVVQNAVVVISISEFDQQFIRSFRDSHIVRVPNAVREDFVRREPKFPETQRVVFSGVIIPRKNVIGLVRAFAKVKLSIPDAILDIAGQITDNHYYNAVVSNIAPSVRESIIFHGNVGIAELVELVESASVAVMFSVYENLPVAIAEALTLGKPVVSTRVGAIAEMVSHGVSGFLVESENEEALAERLIELLNDPQLRRRMGTHGREFAMKKWNPESVAVETVRAYWLALEKAGAP